MTKVFAEEKKSLSGTSSKQCNIRAGRGWGRTILFRNMTLTFTRTALTLNYASRRRRRRCWRRRRSAREEWGEGRWGFRGRKGELQELASQGQLTSCLYTIFNWYLLVCLPYVPYMSLLLSLSIPFINNKCLRTKVHLSVPGVNHFWSHTDVIDWSVTTIQRLWSDLAILAQKMFIHQTFASDQLISKHKLLQRSSKRQTNEEGQTNFKRLAKNSEIPNIIPKQRPAFII